MEDGWIKLWRKSFDSQVFQDSDLWKLWTWCLMKATHREIWIPVLTGRGSTQVNLKPGQFIFGRFEAAKELKMKPSSVRYRMQKLKSIGNLDIKVDTHFSIISVLNWDTYQHNEINIEQATEQATDRQLTGNGQATDTNKNVKNDKNDKNIKNKPFPMFDIFWSAYPKKKSKGDAEKAWLKIRPNEDLLKKILLKIEIFKQAEQWQKDGGKYIPHPATWLNAKGWEDELSEPQPTDETDRLLIEIKQARRKEKENGYENSEPATKLY